MCNDKEACCPDSTVRPRLPKGFTAEELCKITGEWPKRELSRQELLETYKDHYSFSIREEYFATVAALAEKFGPGVYEVVEEVNYKLGYKYGKEQRQKCKTVFNCLADIIVRPYCYKSQVLKASEKKIVAKVFECPTATLAKKLGFEEAGKHLCPKWHQGFADGFGIKFEMREFLLDGGDCCYQTFEERQ